MTGELYLKNLITLGQAVFKNSKLQKVICLNKLSEIPQDAFYADDSYSYRQLLTEVYIPYECKTIGTAAFANRNGLTTIKQYTQSIDQWVDKDTPSGSSYISNVENFKTNCFRGCTSLQLSAQDIQGAKNIESRAFE